MSSQQFQNNLSECEYKLNENIQFILDNKEHGIDISRLLLNLERLNTNVNYLKDLIIVQSKGK